MAKGNWKAWEAKGNVEKGESQRAAIFSLYVWCVQCVCSMYAWCVFVCVYVCGIFVWVHIVYVCICVYLVSSSVTLYLTF